MNFWSPSLSFETLLPKLDSSYLSISTKLQVVVITWWEQSRTKESLELMIRCLLGLFTATLKPGWLCGHRGRCPTQKPGWLCDDCQLTATAEFSQRSLSGPRPPSSVFSWSCPTSSRPWALLASAITSPLCGAAAGSNPKAPGDVQLRICRLCCKVPKVGLWGVALAKGMKGFGSLFSVGTCPVACRCISFGNLGLLVLPLGWADTQLK